MTKSFGQREEKGCEDKSSQETHVDRINQHLVDKYSPVDKGEKVENLSDIGTDNCFKSVCLWLRYVTFKRVLSGGSLSNKIVGLFSLGLHDVEVRFNSFHLCVFYWYEIYELVWVLYVIDSRSVSGVSMTYSH